VCINTSWKPLYTLGFVFDPCVARRYEDVANTDAAHKEEGYRKSSIPLVKLGLTLKDPMAHALPGFFIPTLSSACVRGATRASP